MKDAPHGQAPEDRIRVLIVQCTPLEARYVDEMKRRGGFVDDVDLVKCALWTLAQRFDLIVAPPVFAVGGDDADHVAHTRRDRGQRHESK